ACPGASTTDWKFPGLYGFSETSTIDASKSTWMMSITSSTPGPIKCDAQTGQCDSNTSNTGSITGFLSKTYPNTLVSPPTVAQIYPFTGTYQISGGTYAGVTVNISFGNGETLEGGGLTNVT